MAIRSMTGFAQVKGQSNDQVAFTITLKSVNHRFLDLHLRMPADSDALEMKVRRVFKEKLHRGHVELTLSMERADGSSLAVNRQLVGGYVNAFREAAKEFGVTAEPDLMSILKLPGAMSGSAINANDEALEAEILKKLDEAIVKLDAMRAEEGATIVRELRERMHHLQQATGEVEKLRSAMLHAHMEKINARMQELLGNHADKDRILQEAAMLAERSDIQEELVRMKNHIQHFLGLLEAPGEAGKKLDFLLQEMNRESNTLLSKTSGVAGEALNITQFGLAMKSEIEKSREQVQNIE
jgi:uncharacterized protein (TIGR00255 family)